MKHIAALVADMIDDAIKQMNTMKDSIEFEIPEGYEIDKEQSTNKKVVYKKIEKYEPQEGDLVYAETGYGLFHHIVLHNKSKDIVVHDVWGEWRLYDGDTRLGYHYLRPATAEEAELFASILAKNGYIYDAEKKELCEDKYVPKVGDLVYSGSIGGGQASIYLYESYSPSIHRGFNSKGWNFSAGTVANVQFIRRATAEEAALFTRILDENGYEYDMVKKEVRKKRWRAEKGGQYFYVSTSLIVCVSSDLYCLQGNVHYNIGNYFRTREEAEEVAAEFRKILNNKKA